jgi:hypothetical protein
MTTTTKMKDSVCFSNNSSNDANGRNDNDENAGRKNIAERYKDLIDAFDGRDDAWLRAEPKFLELHSLDLIAITGDENRDYDWSKSFLKKFADNGHVSKVKEIELIKDGKGIRAVVQNIIDGNDMGFTEQAGVVQNNKVVLWGAVIQDGETTELSKKANEVRWNTMIETVQRR